MIEIRFTKADILFTSEARMNLQSDDKRYVLNRLRKCYFELVWHYVGCIKYVKESTNSGGNNFLRAPVVLTSLDLTIGSDLEKLYYNF